MSQKISEHFKRSEFMCQCGRCGRDAVDAELLYVLEDLYLFLSAKYLGERIYIEIVSGNRCPLHNSQQPGASSSSQHLFGKAADIKGWLKWHQKQIDPNIIFEYLDRMYEEQYGVGQYDSFTHIDVRPGPARWDLRKARLA